MAIWGKLPFDILEPFILYLSFTICKDKDSFTHVTLTFHFIPLKNQFHDFPFHGNILTIFLTHFPCIFYHGQGLRSQDQSAIIFGGLIQFLLLIKWPFSRFCDDIQIDILSLKAHIKNSCYHPIELIGNPFKCIMHFA